jgi:hypothetical protein
MSAYRLILHVSSLLLVLSGPALLAAPTQVELDRIVSRVEGRIVTQSDIRQARALKLVEDTSSDAATLRGLETRLLMLHELSRAAPLPPAGASEVDARRGEWVATVGGETQVADLLQQSGMSPAHLDDWLRDDLRIRAYLHRQFGMLGEAERAQGMAEWLARLRQRAGLPQ